jgi:hypothetical protein
MKGRPAAARSLCVAEEMQMQMLLYCRSRCGMLSNCYHRTQVKNFPSIVATAGRNDGRGLNEAGDVDVVGQEKNRLVVEVPEGWANHSCQWAASLPSRRCSIARVRQAT